MNSNLNSQILAAINFGDLNAILITAGLALVGIAFLSFVLRQAIAAANGNPGGDPDPDDDGDDDYPRGRRYD